MVRNLLALVCQNRSRPNAQAARADFVLRQMPIAGVEAGIEAALVGYVDDLWRGGWQPVEVRRQGRRGCPTAAGGRLIALAIAVDHAQRRADTLDPRWLAQVEGLDLPTVDGRTGWVHRWADDEGLDRFQAIDASVDAMANLLRLPSLDPILPSPGRVGSTRSGPQAAATTAPAGADADPVLQRIRSLLAKAESTEFEAEATAFTAKAQELMTRHAIDAAVVAGRSGECGDEPSAIRVPLDAPYADVKSLLLQTVAQAGRCQAVFHGGLDLSTVVGFPADLAAVEMLFTSLLIQAQTSLTATAKRAPAGTRVRSQSYRSSFLQAYTGRIGDRLEEINQAVFAAVEAEQGGAFLPVLASRSDDVEGFMAERFGELKSFRVRGGYDPAGWAGGKVAADNAELNPGRLDPSADSMALGTGSH